MQARQAFVVLEYNLLLTEKRRKYTSYTSLCRDWYDSHSYAELQDQSDLTSFASYCYWQT
jgi:hypothetical protein